MATNSPRPRWKRIELIAALSTAVATAVGGAAAVASTGSALFYWLRAPFGNFEVLNAAVIVVATIAAFVAIATVVYQAERQRSQNVARVEKAEDEFRKNPEKPQLAWDLARSKLESYLDRNLGQATWIFWLTIFVMGAGFSVIAFGVYRAFGQPTELNVSIVSSASGIIISFLGASFLLVYRSVVQQTRSYVSVLERINAVGMAVQVLTTISDDGKDLKNQATVTLAKQLLDLYSAEKPI